MRKLATLAAIAVTGCADPYTAEPEKTPPGPPLGEEISKPVEEPPEHGIPSRTPEAAARRAAELAGNWTSETIVRQHADLARRTIGKARDEAQQIAARATTDPQLSKPGAKSIAIVHAVTASGTGDRRRIIVVTHETLVGKGLRESRWKVTIADAVNRRGGWVISRLEPQP